MILIVPSRSLGDRRLAAHVMPQVEGRGRERVCRVMKIMTPGTSRK